MITLWMLDMNYSQFPIIPTNNRLYSIRKYKLKKYY